jgi:glutathione synthase/RimK-type ligase-like ATP-grasp enzyme
MHAPKLLVLTSPQDDSASVVIELLSKRKIDVLRFDPADLGRCAQLSVRLSGTRKRTTLTTVSGAFDLEDISCVWTRRPGKPGAGALNAESSPFQAYAHDELAHVADDTFGNLAAAWIPASPEDIKRADSKLRQLALASRLGFTTPDTLVTMSGGELTEFYRAHDGRILDKLPGPIFYRTMSRLGQPFVRYAQLVTTRDLVHGHRLETCPSLFQPYVDKRSEVRVTVAGERALAVEIDSQATAHSATDWRRYDNDHLVYRPHDLPSAVREGCIALVRGLSLRFGAIDLIVTPDGEYVFLEVNPNGQWLWLEHASGVPISSAIADLIEQTCCRLDTLPTR